MRMLSSTTPSAVCRESIIAVASVSHLVITVISSESAAVTGTTMIVLRALLRNARLPPGPQPSGTAKRWESIRLEPLTLLC